MVQQRLISGDTPTLPNKHAGLCVGIGPRMPPTDGYQAHVSNTELKKGKITFRVKLSLQGGGGQWVFRTTWRVHILTTTCPIVLYLQSSPRIKSLCLMLCLVKQGQQLEYQSWQGRTGHLFKEDGWAFNDKVWRRWTLPWKFALDREAKDTAQPVRGVGSRQHHAWVHFHAFRLTTQTGGSCDDGWQSTPTAAWISHEAADKWTGATNPSFCS